MLFYISSTNLSSCVEACVLESFELKSRAGVTLNEFFNTDPGIEKLKTERDAKNAFL